MENQIEKILDQYDITEKVPIVFIRESSDNAVYCIGEKEKHILRISKRLPLSDVKFEFDTMDHLFKAGISLPKWIKTKNRNFYSSTSEISTAVLFEFLEGVHAERIKEQTPTLGQSYEAGKALAGLHNAGQNFSSQSPRSRTIFSEIDRVIQNKEVFINEFEGGKKFVDEAYEAYEAIKFAKIHSEPKGFIHNDYRVGNVFFQKNNPEKIKGIIDFDWGCVGPLAKDLGLAVMEWSFNDGDTEPDFKIMDSFLEGYNSIANNKIEKGNDLYTWMWFSGLSDTSTWLCDNINTPDFIKRVSRSYMYKKGQYFKSLIK